MYAQLTILWGSYTSMKHTNTHTHSRSQIIDANPLHFNSFLLFFSVKFPSRSGEEVVTITTTSSVYMCVCGAFLTIKDNQSVLYIYHKAIFFGKWFAYED